MVDAKSRWVAAAGDCGRSAIKWQHCTSGQAPAVDFSYQRCSLPYVLLNRIDVSILTLLLTSLSLYICCGFSTGRFSHVVPGPLEGNVSRGRAHGR
jgi:hypothetical protein